MVCLVFVSACSQYRKVELVRSGGIRMSLNLPDDESDEEGMLKDEVGECEGNDLSDEVFIMNAVKDEETGEMVAADVLLPSSVVARFTNVAERSGFVTLGFDIKVPEGMADSKWRLKMIPIMIVKDDTVGLAPVMITGAKYREGQLRGYERYRRFVASIVTDTTDFVRVGQLELFLMRHFPDTYKMKNDSSIVSDPLATTLFGATQQEALKHYTKHIRKRINDKRISKRVEVFRKFVRDPILKEGVRLDTVINSGTGDFVYRYLHTFRVAPGVKKVIISVNGALFADGRLVADVPSPDDMTFYISSLASLVDETPKYKTVIIERKAYDNIKAYLDFGVGSSNIDTTLGNNASELLRIRKSIDDVVMQKDFVLDSLLITASCSPEGAWSYNRMLSMKRSLSIQQYIREYVPEALINCLRTAQIPENWKLLKDYVELDTLLTNWEKRTIVKVIDGMVDPDRTEKDLSRHHRYSYLRQNIYPKLRSVSFEFYRHRAGMVKDTIHTNELDSLYMYGVEALRNLDYQKAADLLSPYRDYNSALACISADRNYTALDILEEIGSIGFSNPKVYYLKAVVLTRLGFKDAALKFYEMAVNNDPTLRYRANLDPELSFIVNLNN